MAPNQRETAVIVLAAGLGKRFRSKIPKVLHLAAGVPLIGHVLRSITQIQPDKLLIVVGNGKDRVIDESQRHTKQQLIFVEQPEPKGTGDATKRCKIYFDDQDATVVVVPGDTPMIRPESLRALTEHHEKTAADVTLLVAKLEDPTGYGRIIRNQEGSFHKIVEEADASPTEQQIDEVSTGIWCFNSTRLFEALERITPDNAQGEYYLPDAAFVIASEGGIIEVVMAENPDEVLGVNDRTQLAEVSRRIRLRRLETLAANGVTIEDPFTIYIDEAIEVGAETVIKPNTYIEGKSQIGTGCSIGPNTRIVDSIIEDGAEITFSVVRGSHIGPDANVGPYASIRPGTRLGARAKVGTFVEVKGSIIGEDSKVPHQAYVGDAEIGRGVNLGAGTITGNYDTESKVKSKTVIEDDAFTGSNTTLIAPVTLGKGAGTGAGAVVTKDVPEGEVVAGVPAKPMRRRRSPKEEKKQD